MREECLICKGPLEYLSADREMVCELCGKTVRSKTRCIHGHYVCDACHAKGLDRIVGLCLAHPSKDPVRIFSDLAALPFCHMHGPEHHVMVGAALLTAFRNVGGEVDLPAALKEMLSRGQKVPGGVCGFWGACGAGISTGTFLSVLTDTTPLSGRTWGLSNRMTARALDAIGSIGGPRCCKRDSYLAITEAVAFVKEHLGVEMELSEIQCSHYPKNAQCIKEKCPFYPLNSSEKQTETV